MVNYGIFARRSFWHFICVLSFSILFTMQLSAENKSLKDELEHSLSGTTLISTIVVGDRAIPRGDQADYPVNTLVYPNSRDVTYRVEWGTRAEIDTRDMQRYFDRGTSFYVSSVGLKDDCLELQLESAKGDSARLKLMLGAGWQSKFDSSSIQAQLARVFVFDRQPQPKQRTAVAAGFGDTFSQMVQVTPSKHVRAVAGTGGEVFGELGGTGTTDESRNSGQSSQEAVAQKI